MQARQIVSVRSAATVFVSTMILMLLMQPAQAQTFSVLHYFTGGEDGALPIAGVTVGPGGVLYGTASQGGNGGNGGYGTVFKLKQFNSSWVFSLLYQFTGGSDGFRPTGGVVIGPNGALYGTTQYGGGPDYGTVYELRPPATFCRSVTCYWGKTVLYTFRGPSDGANPYMENLVFDQAGDIYGTTLGGGTHNNQGTVFELTPSGGGYTESILHSFGFGTDGADPFAGVVLDAAGNVYGTAPIGGTGGDGTVYQLLSSNQWGENILVNFDGANGVNPIGNLIIDASGNLYGTTSNGGQNNNGVVFKLSPSDGGFTYSVLYSFSSFCGSYGGLAMDAAGNFFGQCSGWVFELTNCNNACIVVDLHDFSGNDGDYAVGSPVLDANGNLYGTTELGGTGSGCGEGCGVVWEIAGVGAPRRN
jgi:uncharacterized repeat protein (TIGR03803 family)